MLQEEAKTLPFSDIWTEDCQRQGVPAGSGWYDEVLKYEASVQSKRN